MDIVHIEQVINEVAAAVAGAEIRFHQAVTLTLRDKNGGELAAITRTADSWREPAAFTNPRTGGLAPYHDGETWGDIIERMVQSYTGVVPVRKVDVGPPIIAVSHQQSAPTNRRIIAKFQPQTWIGNIAHNAGPPLDIDITETILSMSASEIRRLQDNRDTTDALIIDKPAYANHIAQYGANAAFHVQAEQAIADFFGVETPSMVTETMLVNSRTTCREAIIKHCADQATSVLADTLFATGLVELTENEHVAIRHALEAAFTHLPAIAEKIDAAVARNFDPAVVKSVSLGL